MTQPIACPAARLFGWIHAEDAPALVRFGVTTQPPDGVSTQPNIEPHHTHAYECPECRLRITCRHPHHSDADWLSCEILNAPHDLRPPFQIRHLVAFQAEYRHSHHPQDANNGYHAPHACQCLGEDAAPYTFEHTPPIYQSIERDSIHAVREIARSCDYRIRRGPRR